MLNLTEANAMSIAKHPNQDAGRPLSEIELTERNDSASVHAGRSYPEPPTRDRYESLQQVVNAAPCRPSPLPFRARAAAAESLRKQRITMEAKTKRLRQQISDLQKLDRPTSELWAQYAKHYAGLKYLAGWGTLLSLSIIGFFGGYGFLKGAYDEHRAMANIQKVLEAGGAQAGLDKLREELEATQQALAAVVRHLNDT